MGYVLRISQEQGAEKREDSCRLAESLGPQVLPLLHMI